MAEEQKVGRSEEFMMAFASATENFDKAKVLFYKAKKFIEEAINEDPANEDKIKEASKDLFDEIRSAMFANLKEMGKLLGLPEAVIYDHPPNELCRVDVK